MNRKLMAVLTVTAFVSGISFAMGDAANNKICPVSGEVIKKGEEGTVEYEGKSYNLCCAMCAKDFKKDPKKYVQKIDAMRKKEQTKGGTHEHDHGTP